MEELRPRADRAREELRAPLKSPNLDYRRLTDHLTDKGLVDRETVQHVLQQCQTTGALLPEILVTEGFVSDWELSRVCSELFHLPYLPLECYAPSEEAREGLDESFLRQYGLIPLDRFGDVVTVAMPGVVPTEVLEALGGGEKTKVLPVVGSVTSNRRWIDENLGAGESVMGLGGFGEMSVEDDSWANLFDDADQAVNLDLGGEEVGGSSAATDVTFAEDEFSLDIELPGEGEAA